MLNIYKYKTPECDEFLAKLNKRASSPSAEIIKTVTDILEDVKENGDKALLTYTEKFDRVTLTKETLEMSREDLEELQLKKLQATVKRAFEKIPYILVTFDVSKYFKSYFTQEDNLLNIYDES